MQGVVMPATVVTAFAAALAPLYNWLLVDYFEIGLAGAALANDSVQVRPVWSPWRAGPSFCSRGLSWSLSLPSEAHVQLRCATLRLRAASVMPSWAGDGAAGPHTVCYCAGPQPEGLAPADVARLVRP